MKKLKAVMAAVVGLVMAIATMVPVPALTAATALKVGTAGVAVAYLAAPDEAQASEAGISGPVGNSLAVDVFLISLGGMLYTACPPCIGIAAAVSVPATALVMKQIVDGPAIGGRGSS